MKEETLQQIKKDLLAQKENLEKELSNFTKQNPKNKDDYDADFPDLGNKEDENAAEVALFGDNLTLEHTLEKNLRDVNNTLKRIEEGKYGDCKYCKQEIDERRLLARPVSSSCVGCKTELKKVS